VFPLTADHHKAVFWGGGVTESYPLSNVPLRAIQCHGWSLVSGLAIRYLIPERSNSRWNVKISNDHFPLHINMLCECDATQAADSTG